MLTTKRSARVALYVNLRNPLHADEKHASEGIHRKTKTAVPVILRKCTTLFDKVTMASTDSGGYCSDQAF